MPLRRLVIDNVRSIRHVDIDFSSDDGSRQWTVLLGENGTGKSTILRCAALVLAGSDALADLLREAGSWVRNGAESASIRMDFATKDGEPRHAALEWSAKDTLTTVLRRNDANLRELDSAIARAQRNYFVAAYGSSRRLPAKDSQSLSRSEVFSTPRAQAVATLFSRDAAMRSLDAWAMDLEYRKETEGLEIVRSALDALLPGVQFSHIDRERRELLFKTPDGLVPIDRLSDGYQNMAGWIGDFLFRLTDTFSDYRNPLDAGAVLLLDEIDLHLHPVWQRQLLQFLGDKFRNFQFIVTTHSPFTAHQAPPQALHVVQRGSEGPPEVRRYEGDPRLLRVEQLLDPLLGLSTAESFETQNLKKEYRALKDRATRDPGSEARLREVSERLEALPQAQAVSSDERERLVVLKNVEQLLKRR